MGNFLPVIAMFCKENMKNIVYFSLSFSRKSVRNDATAGHEVTDLSTMSLLF